MDWSLLSCLAVLGLVTLSLADSSGTDSNGCRHIVVTDSPQYSFSNAQSQCHARGGALAIIKDQATQTFISNHVPAGTSDYWIGGAYSAASGQWVWDDGTIIPLPGQSGYHNWYTAPSDSSNKGCLLMGRPQWYNAACNNAQALPYICQVADRNPCSSSPCDRRHQCRSTVCQYFCDSCATGYYGDDCRYLNTKLISKTEQATTKNNSISYKFSCTFAGFPLPNITWLFNGTEINTNDIKYDITTMRNPGLDQIQQNLTIYQPRCFGNATVICRSHQNYTNVVDGKLTVDPNISLIHSLSVMCKKNATTKNLIVLSWNPPEDALNLFDVSFNHEVTVSSRNATSASFVTERSFFVTKGKYSTEIENLKSNTTYEFSVTIHITSCGADYSRTLSSENTTEIVDVPAPTNARANSNLISDGIFQCSIEWSVQSNSVAKIFRINSTGIRVYTRDAAANVIYNNSTYLQLNEIQQKNGDMYSTAFQKNLLLSNTNYTFTISASSCFGDDSQPANVSGHCITAVSAPVNVPDVITLEKIGHNHTTVSAYLPKINEENGLVSCVFIIVIVNGSESSFNEDRFKTIAVNQYENKYIALAFSYNGTKVNITIGDGSTSNCQLPRNGTANGTLTGNEIVNGKNYALGNYTIFQVFVVSATTLGITSYGKIKYGFSNGMLIDRDEDKNKGIDTTTVKLITTTENITGSTESSNITVVVATSICLAVLAILLVALAVFIIRKKRTKNLGRNSALSVSFKNKYKTNMSEVTNSTRVVTGEHDDSIIKLSELESIYKGLMMHGLRGFQEEFEGIGTEAAGFELPHTEHGLHGNRSKNRYKNIYPFDHSRVVLVERPGHTGYINACYIDGHVIPQKFIATQGPKTNTVNDFWRMIWEKNVVTIVMLTKCVEKKKEKSCKYWPVIGKKHKCDEITVYTREEAYFGGYWRRILVVTNTTVAPELPREIIQFHVTKWPDHGVPVSTSIMLRLHKHILIEIQSPTYEYDNVGPVVVHCSAGVGRTGTFIALDILKEQMTEGDRINIRECVLKMRKSRTEMIQTLDQFVYLHKLILELHVLPNSDKSPEECLEQLADPSLRRIMQEFNQLDRVPPIKCAVKVAAENKERNRDQSCVPYDKNRVAVRVASSGLIPPYVNASHVENYIEEFQLIAAQSPMLDEEEDFWTMVWDNDVRVTVLLHGKGIESASDFGQLTVYSEVLEDSPVYVEKKLILTRNGSKYPFELVQLEFKLWDDVIEPPPPESLIKLITRMTAVADNDVHVAICCENGCGRTGALCAIYLLLERLKTENRIDVFRTVKDLRDARPNMVNSFDLYKYVYETVKYYINSFNLYGNYK